MAEIGSWNGHRFVVSPTLIQSFSDLSIKGSSETEEKTGNGEKYVSRKNGKPFEVGLKVELNAYLGSDVRKEAMLLVEEAEKGESGYFYVAGKKLLPCKLMLVEASAGEIAMSPGGVWISCEVQLKMKQASKGDNTPAAAATGGGGGSGSGKGGWWENKVNYAKSAADALKSSLLNAIGETTGGKAAGTTPSTGSSFQTRLQTVTGVTSEGRSNTTQSGGKTPVKSD